MANIKQLTCILLPRYFSVNYNLIKIGCTKIPTNKIYLLSTYIKYIVYKEECF